MDLVVAGVAGLGIGVGLVVGLGILRLIRRAMDDNNGHKP